MTPVVIFAYQGDAIPVVLAARSAVAAGCMPVIVDDAAHPLPGHVRGALWALGAEYQADPMARRGNLNGTDVAAWIARKLADAALRHGSWHAIKLDADTLLVDAGRFRGTVGCKSSSVSRRDAFGACYSLQYGTASIVASSLAAQPVDPEAPEDLTIWAEIRRLVLPHHLEDFDPERGLFCAAPPWASVGQARNFAAITFGNPPRDPSWRQMRAFLEYLERTSQDLGLSSHPKPAIDQP